MIWKKKQKFILLEQTLCRCDLKSMEHKVVKDDKVTFINFGWEGNAKARYIRYQASSGEFGGFLFTDEIVVK